MELNEALKTLKSEGFVAEGFFGNAYTRYKAKVLAALKEIGVIIHDQQALEAWIRDFFVDRCDVQDCIQSCRENIKSFGSKPCPTCESRKTVDEVFMKDDRGNVAITDLVKKIIEKAGFVYDNEDAVTSAAYYIADFYSKQSMPINGMVMWGSRDLQKFKRMCDQSIQTANSSEEINACEYKAVTNTRSIMLGNPGRKARWIEEIKAEYRAERQAAEEKRRQDYLASDEYKRSQDPGWRGPNGTWSND